MEAREDSDKEENGKGACRITESSNSHLLEMPLCFETRMQWVENLVRNGELLKAREEITKHWGKKIDQLVNNKKNIRNIGFDDAPRVEKHFKGKVNVAGIVCANNIFEGMLWGEVTGDGMDATESLAKQLLKSKFFQQLHIVLIDGICLGGFNVVDIEVLSLVLQLPVVTVMRKEPRKEAMISAIKDNMSDSEERIRRIEAAGEIHNCGAFLFQVYGCPPEVMASALAYITSQTTNDPYIKIPESLRLAHIIGFAVVFGESGKKA
eukprot:Nk52_evm41s222 gene=Nk52_evmTU41s222